MHNKDRESNLERIRSSSPIPTFVQVAVNGNVLSNSDISKTVKNSLHKPNFPFALRLGEIGLFLSHRLCWKRMLDEDREAVLILEDDASFKYDFNRVLDFALDNIEELGFINFPVRSRKTDRRVVKLITDTSIGNLQICEPLEIPHGTVAYLISRAATQKLLAASERFDRPVDCFLQLRNVTGQRIFMMDPSLVTHDSYEAGISTIHSNDKQMPWLQRETKRFLYRRKVKQLSRQYWNEIVLPKKHTVMD